MARNTTNVIPAALVALLAVACGAAPAAPFDTLKNSNLTAFRLQNYEPPAPVAGTPAAGLPGLPPEIQRWVQAGAQGLQQLIPPGLLPPGLLPQGTTPPQPGQPQMGQVPRFPANSQPNFRILSQTPVMDPDLKEQLAELLGDPDSFDSHAAPCEYSELGLSFGGAPGAMTNDVLISFSCNRVIARNFAWPHPTSGMKPDTVKELASIVQKLFPPGT